MSDHEEWMARALALAREAAAAGEVPVGCVIVRKGVVIGEGRNRREEKRSTLSHAETEAIAMANEALGSWRLDDCALYVTLEPCPMCAGAILNARIPRVYYGARDSAFGACGEGFLRVSYAYSLKDLKEALGRMARFVGRLDQEKQG